MKRSGKATLFVAIAVFAPGLVHAADYMQIKPTKYCGLRGDGDPDLMIKGCEDALNTGLLARNLQSGAWSNLAVAYIRKGDNDKAVDALTHAVAVDPNEWFVYVNRGGIYDEQHKYDLAQADLDKAVSLRPSEPTALRARGEHYLETEKYDLAVADFSRAIDDDAKDAKAYGYRAQAYDAQGKTDLAIADRAMLAKLDPGDTLGLQPKKAAVK